MYNLQKICNWHDWAKGGAEAGGGGGGTGGSGGPGCVVQQPKMQMFQNKICTMILLHSVLWGIGHLKF